MKSVLIALALTIPLAGSRPLVAQQCLHDKRTETPAQRARREQALRLAQMINAAEAMGPSILPGQRRPDYRPLDQLPIIPATPAGFRLQFHTDGATYSLSIKDTTDPCNYAIFSDQDRRIYEASPRTGVYVVPADTN